MNYSVKRILTAAFFVFAATSGAHAQSANVQTNARARDADVFYPADQYPTAQGHYLTLPPAARPQAAPAQALPPQKLQTPTFQDQASQPVQTQYQILSSSLQPTVAPQTRPAMVQANTPTTVDDLPNYSYSNPYSPYKTPIAHDGPPKPKGGGNAPAVIDLSTQRGFQLGLQGSLYRYQEHIVADTDFVHETGPKIGLTAAYTGLLGDGFFLTGDLRAAYGQNDYAGSGTASGIPDWLFEMRLVGGKDFIFYHSLWDAVDFSITPYAGFGFRFLYNNFATVSPGGYDRYSHYLYIPVGVTPRIRLTSTSRISMTLEYDQFIYGWQDSELGDAVPGATTLENTQTGGYGVRADVMYEWVHWSFGPFINYWNINASNVSSDNAFIGSEPNNQTLEVGVQVKYKF